MFRTQIAILAFCVLSSFAFGSDVTVLRLKCVDRQEISYDDIYLEFEVDGQKVDFGRKGPPGTSEKRTVNMTDGRVFSVPSEVLRRLTFKKTLTVYVFERDLGVNDTFGSMTIRNSGRTEKALKGGRTGRKFEYRLEISVK